jgi:hypothetical protein
VVIGTARAKGAVGRQPVLRAQGRGLCQGVRIGSHAKNPSTLGVNCTRVPQTIRNHQTLDELAMRRSPSSSCASAHTLSNYRDFQTSTHPISRDPIRRAIRPSSVRLICFTWKRSLFAGHQETAATRERSEVGPDIARCHAKRHHVEHVGFRVGLRLVHGELPVGS